MDDHRARKMLDALADLFLTGVKPVADATSPTDANAAAPSSHSPTGPNGQGSEDQASALRQMVRDVHPTAAPPATAPPATAPPASSPIRLPPKIVATPPRPPVAPPVPVAASAAPVVDDAPPPLKFPGDATRRDSGPSPHAPAKPRLEAVMLGNLPGFSGPWLNQYAHDLASRLGPVVVLHMDDETVELDVVSAVEQRREIRQMSAALRQDGADVVTMVQTLAEPGELAVAAWLVHLSLPLTPAARQIARDIDRWTVLCGADDAAVVSTYRTFKQLLEADPRVEQRQPGVMVMGVDEDRAQATADKLNQAARSFLHVPIELLGMRKRMVPVNVETLGSFAQKPTLWRQIGSALGESFDAAWHLPQTVSAPPEREREPQSRREPEQWPEPKRELSREPQPSHEPEPVSVIAEVPRLGDAPSLPDTAPQRSESAEVDADVDAAESVESVDATVPSTWTAAVAHAGFAGDAGSLVSPHLPDADEEVIATAPVREAAVESKVETEAKPERAHVAPPLFGDGDGDDETDEAAAPSPPAAPEEPAPPPPVTQVRAGAQPDLLALIEGQGIRQGEPLKAQCPRHPHTQLALDAAGRVHLLRRHQANDEDLRSAITDLLDAQAWVREHRQLLQLTCPRLRMDGQSAPVLHLFTEQAKAAVKLTAGAGQLVKLRLLQSVQLRGETAWVCVELN